MSRSDLRSIAVALITLSAGAALAQQPTPAPKPTPAPVAAPAPAPAAPAPAPAAAGAAAAAAPAAAPAAAAPAAVAESTVAKPAPKPAAPAPAPSLFQQKMSEFLLRGITLTPEQKTKLDSLMASHREDRAAFIGTAGDSAAMAARIRVVKKHMAENRAVLTEEQQKIYDRNLSYLKELFQ